MVLLQALEKLKTFSFSPIFARLAYKDLSFSFVISQVHP